MRILIVTDTYSTQINGVARVLSQTEKELIKQGHTLDILDVKDCVTVPFPPYPEIKVAVFPRGQVKRRVEAFQPDSIHILTEGTLGWSARAYCMRNNIAFTSSFLSKFAEYLSLNYKVPHSWLHLLFKRFHRAAAHTMVTTEGMRQEAYEFGIEHVRLWRRGVDFSQFRSVEANLFSDHQGPIMLYVGRLSFEKNIEAFLSLQASGTKVIVGDGPRRKYLEQKFPDAVFCGVREGENLVQCYNSADVFVFPSLTDTFGLVNLEALACGLPVAAFPVTGPKDIIGNAPVGALDKDLGKAITEALRMKPEDCIKHASQYSWQAAAEDFISNLVPVTAKHS
ncbi:glycosyltransferase family 4 protein [Flexibacterium corallicola]|uniref:glycosyltransferase family 4 protein n=1 Tax=Flexibacterium corallicola TaxID=3037259 RepID=UPI00286F62FB|nr:glycosyltransferase family 1 protein [Pseudovibrio sp. M1P-2-3]